MISFLLVAALIFFLGFLTGSLMFYTRKAAPIRKADIPWGEGKDMSALLPDSPRLLELLPSEISQGVFQKIETEWEKQHPDPVKELKKELAEKDELIANKSRLIASLQRHVYSKGMRESVYRNDEDWL